MKVKLNVALPSELLKKIDEEAKKNFTTRTGILTRMITFYFDRK